MPAVQVGTPAQFPFAAVAVGDDELLAEVDVFFVTVEDEYRDDDTAVEEVVLPSQALTGKC